MEEEDDDDDDPFNWLSNLKLWSA